jgi:hypothetical protein
MMVRNSIVAVVCLLLAGRSESAAGEDQQGLLETARAGHRCSTDLIQTFSCDLSIQYALNTLSKEEACQCWRKGTSIRYKGRESDLIVVDGTATSIGRRTLPTKAVVPAATICKDNGVSAFNPWTCGLLAFTGDDKFAVSFDELLSQPHELHSVKRVSSEGREWVCVDLSHKQSRLEIWLGPHVNYMVGRVRERMFGSTGEVLVDHDKTVTGFREYSSGVFFPERVETRVHDAKQPGLAVDTTGTIVATFSNVAINQPLPEGTFEVHFPPGMRVADLIRGKVNLTDANGVPNLPVDDPVSFQLTRGRAIQLAPEAPETRVTQAEATPWTRWLLPAGSLLLLSVAAGVWLRRRASPGV